MIRDGMMQRKSDDDWQLETFDAPLYGAKQ